ncbi:hypothetical protein FRC03_011051 [Tulasnella sp. 419]|nr:hypothetical protein FRC03_011051 [Tulasnella sp. 419]
MQLFKKIALYWTHCLSSGDNSVGSGTNDILYDAVARWDMTRKARFRRITHVFSGFFSDVYRGTTRLNGDPRAEVAIKVLRFHGPTTAILSERSYKRFYSEVLIWSRLDHPNIAQLHGFTKPDQPDDMPTIISRWYNNGNIVNWLNENVSTNRMMLLRDIISVVAYLHSQHIVHGDIKAENFLIDDAESPRLCDFGLSHFINECPEDLDSIYLTSAHLGATVCFSSPELLETGRSTSMSDTWALGCLAIQVLTNQPPYAWMNKKDRFGIIRIITSGCLPFDISAFAPRNTLEGDLLDNISACWTKNADSRPSAAQLLSNVDALIAHGLQISTPLPMRGSL